MNVIEFFPGPLYCCDSIKTVNNQTLLKCGLLMNSQPLQPFVFQIAVHLTLFIICF